MAAGLGVGWWALGGETPLASTTDQALQRKLDAAVEGAPAPLAELTGFSWDQVRVFDYGTDDDVISEAVGDPVEWEVAATSYTGPSLWVFSKGGEAVRAVQLDANAPANGKGGSWSKSVRISGGPDHNVVTLTE
ncbi:hypothetical protein [Streptomyces sp. MST-110588]|uniref:hypothetical protein n=1 Tax=Streptomyces sp. MST-110588 TaxID=2833628 RepID=UPI001F5DB9E5|nr:hypothetical protein [Streptomyces sp. MST-110588]UNO43277.1 hypothetical protein KGS77_32065 [Streptomyces sp. MST-110588]